MDDSNFHSHKRAKNQKYVQHLLSIAVIVVICRDEQASSPNRATNSSAIHLQGGIIKTPPARNCQLYLGLGRSVLVTANPT